MAKFNFRLEAVENLKKQSEQKALEELSHYQRIFMEKLELKQEIMDKKKNAFAAKNELLSKDANINEIRGYDDYITGLNVQIIKADQAIIRTRRFLEQAMKQYVQKRKEKMMLEKLHEKDFVEFKQEQARLLQKQLDDLISVRARLNHGPLDDIELNEEEESA